MSTADRRSLARSAVALSLLLAMAAGFWIEQTTAGENRAGSSPASSAEFGGAVEVLFSSPDSPQSGKLESGADVELAAAIERAQASVEAALYDLNLWRVRDALLAAHRRGLQVRLVMEANHADRAEVIDLQQAGIPVHFDERSPLMHHKFVILDRRRVWTGSMNWTINGVYRNDNDVLIIDSMDMAANYSAEFEEMFQHDRFGELSRNDTPFPFLVVGEAAVETAFSPDDGVRARLLRYLNRASQQVEVLAFTLTSDEIAGALLSAHERGVQVRGVFEAARIDDLGADVEALRQAGLPLRLDTNPNTMHHKAILIDGHIVITGSYNFTNSAEERNDENILFIDNSDLYQRYLTHFEQLYQAAVP